MNDENMNWEAECGELKKNLEASEKYAEHWMQQAGRIATARDRYKGEAEAQEAVVEGLKNEVAKWRAEAERRAEESLGVITTLEKERDEWQRMYNEQRPALREALDNEVAWKSVAEQRAGLLEELKGTAKSWEINFKEAVKQRDGWKENYEKTRADQQMLVGQRLELEKERDDLKKIVMLLEKECQESQQKCVEWQAEAERWRKARCGEVGEHSKPLSAWKNYDHAAEIEAVRDELARSQSVIAEKERELERMEMRSGIRLPALKQYDSDATTRARVGRAERVQGEAEAKKILDEIFADLSEENPVKECADGLREAVGEYCKSLEKSVEAAKHEFLGECAAREIPDKCYLDDTTTVGELMRWINNEIRQTAKLGAESVVSSLIVAADSLESTWKGMLGK